MRRYAAGVVFVTLVAAGCAAWNPLAREGALVADAQRLAHLGVLLNLHAAQHEGAYPARLEELAATREQWRGLATCELSSPATLYTYLAGRTQHDHGARPLAVGTPSPVKRRVNILTVSGKVYDVSAEKADEITRRR